MPALTRKDRLRRVVLLCTHFVRNLAYYRGARESPSGWRDRPLSPDARFWRTMANNCIDLCVLEFCKLFADRNGRHCWRKVVSPAKAYPFEADMLRHVGMSTSEWDAYLEQMRNYRDKFVAHLDNDIKMQIPHLDPAKLAVEFYHSHVVKHEAQQGMLNGLVDNVAIDMTAAYEQEKTMAALIFGNIDASRR
jgi:hypothetical protein